MTKPAARMGDPTAHGGTIVAGFPTVLIGGQPAARISDMHVCPMVTPGTPPIPHARPPARSRPTAAPLAPHPSPHEDKPPFYAFPTVAVQSPPPRALAAAMLGM